MEIVPRGFGLLPLPEDCVMPDVVCAAVEVAAGVAVVDALVLLSVRGAGGYVVCSLVVPDVVLGSAVVTPAVVTELLLVGTVVVCGT